MRYSQAIDNVDDEIDQEQKCTTKPIRCESYSTLNIAYIVPVLVMLPRHRFT